MLRQAGAIWFKAMRRAEATAPRSVDESPRCRRRRRRSQAASDSKSPWAWGVDKRAEAVVAARDLDVVAAAGGDLEENAGVGATLVQLAGGVKEAGAVAEGDGTLKAVAEEGLDDTQAGVVGGRAVEVGLDGDVVARAKGSKPAGQGGSEVGGLTASGEHAVSAGAGGDLQGARRKR